MNNIKEGFILSEITSKIQECLTNEKLGHNEKAKLCYSEVYALLVKAADTEDKTTRERRLRQAELIKSKLDSFSENIKKGNTMQEDYAIALQDLGARIKSNPTKKFADISGLEEVKKSLLLNLVYPIKFYELSKEFNIKRNRGVLLYGPPGNGKTLIAESVAGEAGINFLEINPAFLYNELFGKFEKNLTKLFDIAHHLSPCVIFFDEVDTLMPRRDNINESVIRRGVSQLLIEINKVMEAEEGRIFILAATNLPWEIDPAMLRPGRFDLKLYVPPPNLEARKEMIRKFLSSIHYDKDIDIDQIGTMTDGFSAADVEFIGRKSSEKVFLEAINNGVRRPISQNDIMEAISSVKPSVSKAMISRYENYLANH